MAKIEWVKQCDECGKPAKWTCKVRPLDWDGVGKEPIETQNLCDECKKDVGEDLLEAKRRKT